MKDRSRELSFDGSAGDRVTARIVDAATPAPAAGLLFLHWGFGDRTSFAREAEAYAAVGATSLLIDAPGFGARRGPRVPAKDARVVRAFAEQFLGDLALALDVLCAQPRVDPARLGLVGHSLGATIAPAFLAREPRVRAAVLMAGTGTPSRLWLNARDSQGARSLEDLDGVHCLRRTRAALLFQFAERDEWIARTDADAQLAAAREPKQTLWYACDHAFDASALRDRAHWLGAQLGFAGDPGLPAGHALPRSQLRRYRMIKPLLRVAGWFSKRSGASDEEA